MESLKYRVFSVFFKIIIKIFFSQISSVKCFNILCAGKFDRHNFIRREKKGGGDERASFSVILKYVVFIVNKYCRFW